MEEINNILEKVNMNSNNNDLSATLKQGLQFKKYQHKIATNKQTEEISFDLEKNDTSGVTGFFKLSDGPSNIVEGFATSTQTPAAQMVQLGVLQVEYNKLIQQFNTEKQKLLTSTNSYIDGISTKNPYLNKNVTTKNDGKTYYITGEGIAKLYPSTTLYNQIIGKNNCPSTTQQIDLLPAYINTTTGTPMVLGQQCGNEGKNVVVNNIIDDTESSYVGCYNDVLTSPAMNKMSGGAQAYDFTSCKQAAIDTGNLYFGLQNLNPTTNKSSCYVSNDLAKSTKYQKSTTACKSDNDGYIYGATSVNAIYKTPDTTYVGVFKEKPVRSMTPINNGSETFTYETCKKEAVNRNKKFFGLQNFNKDTQLSACCVGDDYNTISQYGISTSSYTGKSDSKTYGGTWTNAVYQIDTKKSDYIGCYNDNEASPSMTVVGNGSSKYSFETCQKEAITGGKQYFALQGGKKGLSKCFVSDDLQSAQKYGIYKPCIESASDKNTYGMSGNNALYKMNKAGYPSDMSKIGYVDGNDKLMEYPSSMIIPGINYSKYVGYDSMVSSMKTMTNTTYNDCVTACNSSTSYYGFVFDNSTSTGYLKGKDILNPSLKVPNSNTDLYVRDVKTKNANMSCNRSTVSINSNMWRKYSKGSMMTPNTTCSLTGALSTQNTKIANLQNQIGQVGGKIITILNSLKSQTDQVKSQIGIKSSKIDSDLIMYNQAINDITNYKKGEDNMNNITKDTNLLVLYQNYNYMFWSILAISAMIISMKMMGK
jgi:hypothetical protein